MTSTGISGPYFSDPFGLRHIPCSVEAESGKALCRAELESAINTVGMSNDLNAHARSPSVKALIKRICKSGLPQDDMVDLLLLLTSHEGLATYWPHASRDEKKLLLSAVCDYMPKDRIHSTWTQIRTNLGIQKDTDESLLWKTQLVTRLIKAVGAGVDIEEFERSLEQAVELWRDLYIGDGAAIDSQDDLQSVSIRFDFVFHVCVAIDWLEHLEGVTVEEVLSLCFAGFSMPEGPRPAASGAAEDGQAADSDGFDADEPPMDELECCVFDLAGAFQSRNPVVKVMIDILASDVAVRLPPVLAKALLAQSLTEAVQEPPYTFAAWSKAAAVHCATADGFDVCAFAGNNRNNMAKLLCKDFTAMDAYTRRAVHETPLKELFALASLDDRQKVVAAGHMINLVVEACKEDPFNFDLKHRAIEYACSLLQALAEKVSADDYKSVFSLYEEGLLSMSLARVLQKQKVPALAARNAAAAALTGALSWKRQHQNPYKRNLEWLGKVGVYLGFIEELIVPKIDSADSAHALKSLLSYVTIPEGASPIQYLTDATLESIGNMLLQKSISLHERVGVLFYACGMSVPSQSADMSTLLNEALNGFEKKPTLTYRELKLICMLMSSLDFQVMTAEQRASIQAILSKSLTFDCFYIDGRTPRPCASQVRFPSLSQLVGRVQLIMDMLHTSGGGVDGLSKAAMVPLRVEWLKATLAFLTEVSTRFEGELEDIEKRANGRLDIVARDSFWEVKEMSVRLKRVVLNKAFENTAEAKKLASALPSVDKAAVFKQIGGLLRAISETKINTQGGGLKLLLVEGVWRLRETAPGLVVKALDPPRRPSTPPLAENTTEQKVTPKEQSLSTPPLAENTTKKRFTPMQLYNRREDAHLNAVYKKFEQYTPVQLKEYREFRKKNTHLSPWRNSAKAKDFPSAAAKVDGKGESPERDEVLTAEYVERGPSGLDILLNNDSDV